MQLKETLAQNLRNLREYLELSHRDLAEKANMNPRYLQRVENKGANVTLDSIESIALALGVDAQQLISPNKEEGENKKKIIEHLDKSIENAVRTRAMLMSYEF